MAALLFDLDGTLVDSAPDIHAAVNRLLLEMGQTPLAPETVRSFIGNGVPTLIARVLAATGQEGDPALWESRFMHHYGADSATLTTLYPGVRATLELLSAQGHEIGLCTNKPEEPARHILRAFDLAHLFPVVIGGDSLPLRKPDPAPLHAAIAGLSARPALFIGDSEVDAQTAQAAAVPFLLFTEGYRKSPVADLPHRASFADFAQLPALVARFSQG